MSIKTRLFHLWFLFSRPMTLGVRLVARNEEGKVLLVKHTYVNGWHFPGGGVDIGENCNDAAVRETLEETGMTPVNNPKIFGIYYNNTTSKRDHVVVYTCEGLTGTLNAQDSEIADIGFFAIDDLPSDATAATHKRIAEIYGNADVSAYW